MDLGHESVGGRSALMHRCLPTMLHEMVLYGGTKDCQSTQRDMKPLRRQGEASEVGPGTIHKTATATKTSSFKIKEA